MSKSIVAQVVKQAISNLLFVSYPQFDISDVMDKLVHDSKKATLIF